jgi:CspA family cold shock protein
MDAN